MSHKDAKPKTAEQLRMEAFYNARLAPDGVTIGWGLDKHSEYLAGFARHAWAAWQAAQTPSVGGDELTNDLSELLTRLHRDEARMREYDIEPIDTVYAIRVLVALQLERQTAQSIQAANVPSPLGSDCPVCNGLGTRVVSGGRARATTYCAYCNGTGNVQTKQSPD